MAMFVNCSGWQDDVLKAADNIRIRVLDHTLKNNGGYMSQACSSAEIFASLYLKIMKLSPSNAPKVPLSFRGVPGPHNPHSFTGAKFNSEFGPQYDRFFMSPAQYALCTYAALIEAGRMSSDALSHFNKDGSSVEMIGAEHSPGMEVMTGSLGQGISQAAGVAWARKFRKDEGRVIVFLSDGELQIGQTWEAFQSMVFHKLDNMLIYVDVNGFQCDGKMDSVMGIEPIEKRCEAFGMRTYRIDGHDVDKLYNLSILESDGRPTIILCDTDPKRKLEILSLRAPKYHYLRFTSEDEKNIYKEAFDKQNSERGMV